MTIYNLSDIAKEAGISPIRVAGLKRDVNVDRAIQRLFDVIIEKCAAGNQVRIKGFGTFKSTLYKGRLIKSPLMGTHIRFEDRLVLRFSQSGAARRKLNGQDGGQG